MSHRATSRVDVPTGDMSTARTATCRKKAISRGGGIPALVAVLSGSCAEGSMHAAQGLLHMAKLPDLKVHVMIICRSVLRTMI